MEDSYLYMQPRKHATISQVFEFRHRLWTNGYRPMQAPNHLKYPTDEGWPEMAMQDPPHAVRTLPVWNKLNTCAVSTGLAAIDIDVDNADLIQEMIEYLLIRFGPTPTRYRANSPRVLMLYAAAEGEPTKAYVQRTKPDAEDEIERVEVLGCGQQFHADGIHPSGYRLEWTDPLDTPAGARDKLPRVSVDQVNTFLDFAYDLIGGDKRSGSRIITEPMPVKETTGDEWLLSDVTDVLDSIANNGLDWQLWFDIGAAVFEVTAGSPEGYMAFRQWSSRCYGSKERHDERLWRGLHMNPTDYITGGKLYYHARQWSENWERPSLRITGLRNISRKK